MKMLHSNFYLQNKESSPFLEFDSTYLLILYSWPAGDYHNTYTVDTFQVGLKCLTFAFLVV